MMFLMNKLLLLFCIEKYSKLNHLMTENLNTLYVSPNLYNSKKNHGYDERFPLNNTNSSKTELHKIANYFDKKRLLDILENENVSLFTKILLLNDNSIKSTNIFAGGLMNDFDFDFDNF